MKERPILFSAPMVRAILEGRKTQTRRVVKGCVEESGEYTEQGHMHGLYPRCPYGQPGDRLWVRETFALENTQEYDGTENMPTDGRPIQRHDGWKLIPRYRATEPDTQLIIAECENDEDAMRWTPSIFMPRWASRITLEIESVRVERLNDISQEDARAEGAEKEDTFNYSLDERARLGLRDGSQWGYWNGYKLLWESINGKGSWAINPFVWVVQFHKLT